MSSKNKKTIIIVHGIGEQLPGKSIADFVDGLKTAFVDPRTEKSDINYTKISASAIPEDIENKQGYWYRVRHRQIDVTVKEASWSDEVKYQYIGNVFWFFFRACTQSLSKINLQYPFFAFYQLILAGIIISTSLFLFIIWLIPLALNYLLSFGDAAATRAAAVLSGSFTGSLLAGFGSYVIISINIYESENVFSAFSAFFLLLATGIIPTCILIALKTRGKGDQNKQTESSNSWFVNLAHSILGWITPPMVYCFRKPFDWAQSYLKFLSEPVETSIVKVLGDIEIFVEDIDTARKIKDIVRGLLRKSLKSNEDIYLVGHSLGSVIIYETLCDLADENNELTKVKMIISVGSPLNRIRYFWGQRRRFGREFPRHIQWYNYYSVGDFIGSYLSQFPERDIKNIRVANTACPLPLWSHVKYWKNNFLMKDIWSRVLDIKSLQPLPDENKWIGRAVVHWLFLVLLLAGLCLLGWIFYKKDWGTGFSILLPTLLGVYMLWAKASKKLTEKELAPPDPWIVALAATEAKLAKNPKDPELKKAVREAKRWQNLHRRIRRIPKITSWGIIPLIIVAIGGWLWMRLFLCWSSSIGHRLGIFCSSSSAIPMLVGVGGVVLVSWFILHDLPALGTEVNPAESYRSRIKTGYGSLAEQNRKSANVAFGSFVALLLGMVLLMAGLSFFLSLKLFPF